MAEPTLKEKKLRKADGQFLMMWTKTKLYWRNKQHDATIQGPCEMGWYRAWVRREYKICDSLEEAKMWADSVAFPNHSSDART